MINAAIARIILRYLIGFSFAGSTEIGQMISTDPDIIMALAGVIGVAIEAFYILAKKKGWST